MLLLQLESRESNPSLVLPEDVSIPQEIEVLNPETNTFVSIPATLVKRGDICRFNAGQRVSDFSSPFLSTFQLFLVIIFLNPMLSFLTHTHEMEF